MLMSQKIERTACRMRFFHTTVPGRDAFHYIASFQQHLDPEQKKLMDKHSAFVTSVNAISAKFMENTSCLKSIRKAYTSPELSKLLETAIAKHARLARVNSDILRDLARFIRKCAARDRMTVLGFHADVENIHQDNQKHYGNCLGPTPSFLDKKYQGKNRERAAASERFRTLEVLENPLIKE